MSFHRVQREFCLNCTANKREEGLERVKWELGKRDFMHWDSQRKKQFKIGIGLQFEQTLAKTMELVQKFELRFGQNLGWKMGLGLPFYHEDLLQ